MMRIYQVYTKILRGLVRGMGFTAGGAIVGMMLVTCVDISMRACGRPLTGSYDMVRILGVITIACALPYTTAVKGHVAVELFYHKLSASGRMILDTLLRLPLIVLFVLLAIYNILYGIRLRQSGEMMATLHMPVFWIPYIIAFSSAIVALVITHNMLHPGKAMIRS